MEREVISTGTRTDIGVPELVRRLADDSRRLAADEMHLAKLEIGETLRDATHGAKWLAASFGVAVVAAVALTVGLVSLVAQVTNGRYWLGALVVGALEVIVAVPLIRSGARRTHDLDFTLGRSRAD